MRGNYHVLHWYKWYGETSNLVGEIATLYDSGSYRYGAAEHSTIFIFILTGVYLIQSLSIPEDTLILLLQL